MTGPVTIDDALCVGCGRCVTICPTDVFRADPSTGKAVVTWPGDCHVCFLCVDDCEPRAIALDHSVANHRHQSAYADLPQDKLVLDADAGAKRY